MAFVYATVLFAILLGAGVFFVAKSKNAPSVKLMLLGIGITLLGGIIAIDASSDLGGLEYLIVILGLVVTVIGFIKKD